LRVTQELKWWIDAASKANGRSQSQEVEFRLEQTRRHEELLTDALVLRHGQKGAGVMLAVSSALYAVQHIACHFVFTERGTWSPDNWLDDPRCYEAACEAITLVLQSLYPSHPKKITPPAERPVPGPGKWEGLGVWAAGAAQVQWSELDERFAEMMPGKRSQVASKEARRRETKTRKKGAAR